MMTYKGYSGQVEFDDEALQLFDASMEERQDAAAMTEEWQVKAG